MNVNVKQDSPCNYKAYSYHRIVKILKGANIYLYRIVWYKCNRYQGYRQRYHVKEVGTERTILKDVCLDDLRKILTWLDIPLQENETTTCNLSIEQLLKAVAELENEHYDN